MKIIHLWVEYTLSFLLFVILCWSCVVIGTPTTINFSVKALLHYALIHLRFYFSRVFLAFSLAFLIPTCWYPKRERKREKNARKT